MAEQFTGALINVRTATPPELKYLPNGTAILSFVVITDVWVKGKGRDKETQQVRYRVTLWGQRAEFNHKLLMQYKNPKKDDGKFGVGCMITVMINSLPRLYVYENKNTHEPEVTIEVTASDLAIHSPLPEGAYSTAAGSRGRNGGFGGRTMEEEELNQPDDVSDIPF